MNSIANKDYFTMLVKNFRLAEAVGYIAAQVKMDQISAERGETYERLLRCYKNIVRDALWNDEGLNLLATCEIDTALYNDINCERNRLISTINQLIKNEKLPILYYVSAYYAIANEDRLHFKESIHGIRRLFEGEELPEIMKPLGGYEEFEFIGNELAKHLQINGSIFSAVEELIIVINL